MKSTGYNISISHLLQQPYSVASEKFLKTKVSQLDQRPNNFPSKTSIQDHTMMEFGGVMCYSQFLLQIKIKKQIQRSKSHIDTHIGNNIQSATILCLPMIEAQCISAYGSSPVSSSHITIPNE